MSSIYLGPFEPEDIDTIHRALKAQLDNLKDFLDHGMEPTVDNAVPFLKEQTRIGRIVDRIEYIQLSL